MAASLSCRLLSCLLLLRLVCTVYLNNNKDGSNERNDLDEEPVVTAGHSEHANQRHVLHNADSKRSRSTGGQTEDLCQTRRLRALVRTKDKGLRTAGRFHDCYRKLCTCNRTYADCSQNGGKLDHIPDLPHGIVFLNFSFNDLLRIERADFFSNVSNITGLDLAGNDLSYISDGAFRGLGKLKVLYIGENDQLDYEALAPALVPTLKTLDVFCGNLREIPDDIFSKHPMPLLETLNLQGNFLATLNMTALQPLPRLKHLSLEDSEITKFIPARMKSLISLHLSHNAIKKFPLSCKRRNVSYFPTLQTLALRDNLIRNLSTNRTCFSKLQNVDLSHNAISGLPSEVFGGTRFPKLHTLTLASTQLKFIEKHAFQDSPVEVLSLAANTINFADVNAVADEAFAGLCCVRELYLNNNTLSYIDDGRFHNLFGGLRSLQVLSLGFTGLARISTLTFPDLVGIRELHVHGNSLPEIPDRAFDRNPNLTTLRLHNNRISVISEHTFGTGTRSHLQHLDLHGNPFHCDCNLAWFQQWFQSDEDVFDNRDQYRCKNLKDTDVDSFQCDNVQCPRRCVILSTTFGGLFVLVLIVLGLVCSSRRCKSRSDEATQGLLVDRGGSHSGQLNSYGGENPTTARVAEAQTAAWVQRVALSVEISSAVSSVGSPPLEVENPSLESSLRTESTA